MHWQGNLKEKDPLEDLAIDEMITLKLTLKKLWEYGLIHMAQDRNCCGFLYTQ
jgi:hypothetical protein